MHRFLAAIVILTLPLSAIAADASVRPDGNGQPPIRYFSGLGHPRDWDPAFAKNDAATDIRAGTLLIHVGSCGDVGALGVPYQLFDLLSECRIVDPRFSDAIRDEDDSDRRRRYDQYARLYNREVVRFLLVRHGRKPAEFDAAFFDHVGNERACRAVLERKLKELDEVRKKRANKSPEPTATTVTPPAAQEPRRP